MDAAKSRGLLNTMKRIVERARIEWFGDEATIQFPY
jgi:hypothetical protein